MLAGLQTNRSKGQAFSGGIWRRASTLPSRVWRPLFSMKAQPDGSRESGGSKSGLRWNRTSRPTSAGAHASCVQLTGGGRSAVGVSTGRTSGVLPVATLSRKSSNASRLPGRRMRDHSPIPGIVAHRLAVARIGRIAVTRVASSTSTCVSIELFAPSSQRPPASPKQGKSRDVPRSGSSESRRLDSGGLIGGVGGRDGAGGAQSSVSPANIKLRPVHVPLPL